MGADATQCCPQPPPGKHKHSLVEGGQGLPAKMQVPVLAALLTCHDPLGLIGLHVAGTLPLSHFALEIILGIKGI